MAALIRFTGLLLDTKLLTAFVNLETVPRVTEEIRPFPAVGPDQTVARLMDEGGGGGGGRL